MSYLPEYRSYKKVNAAKINHIKIDEDDKSGSAVLVFEKMLNGSELEDIVVDRRYMKKHKPQDGGYYVLYEDGYESFSPAKAFEDGYSLIE